MKKLLAILLTALLLLPLGLAIRTDRTDAEVTDDIWAQITAYENDCLSKKGVEPARATERDFAAMIDGNVGDNYNLGIVGPLKTTVRITTRTLNSVTGGNKQITAKWGASKNFTGYQVQIATDAKFTQNRKTVTISDYTKAQYTFKNLNAKTIYYVRVRSYTVFEGMTYFGEWSNVKSVRTK